MSIFYLLGSAYLLLMGHLSFLFEALFGVVVAVNSARCVWFEASLFEYYTSLKMLILKYRLNGRGDAKYQV